MKKVSYGAHKFLHKMMRRYLRAYDLDYAAGYAGDKILNRFGDMQAVKNIVDQFYSDMKGNFGIDFGC